MKIAMLFVLSVGSATLSACDDDGASEPAPKFQPPAAGELVTVEPGGEAICSRGTPYRFFAVGGDPRRLVLDFQGGGACWSAPTCSVAEAIFSAEAATTDEGRSLA